ncbi:MAG: fimbrillin family protein [Rikenellaceae bacterium]
MKRVIIAALALAAVVGCAKESVTSGVSSDVVATFAGSEIGTRTTGNDWDGDENVGIYMFKEGETASSGYSLEKLNVNYTSDASGLFTVATDVTPIYYPQSQAVDFYAYYPYSADATTNDTYTLDLTAQNTGNQGDVDFMTASLPNQSKQTTDISFAFDHKLAMVTLVILPNNSVADLKGLSATLTGTYSSVVANVITGGVTLPEPAVTGDINFATEDLETDADTGVVSKLQATAIVAPAALADGAKLSFSFESGQTFTASFPDGTTFGAGDNHTFNVSMGNLEATIGVSTINGWDKSENDTDGVIDAE